jgi:hypothetical protein
MITRMVTTTMIMRMGMNKAMSIGTAGQSTTSTLMLVQMVCFASCCRRCCRTLSTQWGLCTSPGIMWSLEWGITILHRFMSEWPQDRQVDGGLVQFIPVQHTSPQRLPPSTTLLEEHCGLSTTLSVIVLKVQTSSLFPVESVVLKTLWNPRVTSGTAIVTLGFKGKSECIEYMYAMIKFTHASTQWIRKHSIKAYREF